MLDRFALIFIWTVLFALGLGILGLAAVWLICTHSILWMLICGTMGILVITYTALDIRHHLRTRADS